MRWKTSGRTTARRSVGATWSRARRRRLSDSSSVYFEERYQDRGSLTGLTHATGINLVPKERWNFGASTEFGTLRDSLTGAETDRKAAGIRMGYGAMRCSCRVRSSIAGMTRNNSTRRTPKGPRGCSVTTSRFS